VLCQPFPDIGADIAAHKWYDTAPLSKPQMHFNAQKIALVYGPNESDAIYICICMYVNIYILYIYIYIYIYIHIYYHFMDTHETVCVL
jgi:hypothetical protein